MQHVRSALARLGELAESRPVATLARAFASAGAELALVGGPVRDAFLGVPVHDLDFTTNARPDRILEIVRPISDAHWDIGRDFGTIGARIHGEQVEITTYRADTYDGSSRKPEVVFGDTLEGDLGRRDFTVNALALALPDLQLVDPTGGLDDMLTRVLRTPSTPEVSFGDDPLRMLRAVRFTAQLGFTLDPVALDAIFELRGRILDISAERVRDELVKLLLTPSPRAGIELLVASGLADLVLPELPALQLERDDAHRHKDVFAHSITVLENAIELEADAVQRAEVAAQDADQATAVRTEAADVTSANVSRETFDGSVNRGTSLGTGGVGTDATQPPQPDAIDAPDVSRETLPEPASRAARDESSGEQHPAITSPDLVLRLAALLHDIGKPKTRSFGPGGKVMFHGHDWVGAKMTRKRLTALRFDNDTVKQVARLVELHMRMFNYGEAAWTDSAVRRFARDAGPLLDRLLLLIRADITTRNRRKADRLQFGIDDLEARLAALREQEAIDAIRPDLDGDDIMRILKIDPSPTVGEARNFLLELRLDEGPLEPEEAERRLLDWWAKRQDADPATAGASQPTSNAKHTAEPLAPSETKPSVRTIGQTDPEPSLSGRAAPPNSTPDPEPNQDIG